MQDPTHSSVGGVNPAGWPEAILSVAERFITCEFTSLTRQGIPITYPVTPYPGEQRRTLDVSTGLTYPAKAERARRNPKVALLFSDPTGSGMASPSPVVLVQGLATVRDHDLQANSDRYGRESLTKLAEGFRGVPRSLLRRQAWYFARIWIEVTPLRIFWWPEGHTDEPPQRWDAPESIEVSPSDPAPSGKQPSTGEKAPTVWRPGARLATKRFGPPVLTFVDEAEFPVSIRAKQVQFAEEGFHLDVPVGVPSKAEGPACLTFHSHTPTFSTQENRVFTGTLRTGNTGIVFQVHRQLADWSGGRSKLTAGWSFLRRGRRLTPLLQAEAARRGQPIPDVRLPDG